VQEIDIAPRQVLIEARIVEANKTFSRDLGVRLGYGDRTNRHIGNGGRLGFGSSEFGSVDSSGNITTGPNAPINSIIRRVGESATSGSSALTSGYGNLNLTLFNSSLTRFLNLELVAQETDGRIRLVSSPRVLTANQVEALIEQGTEIPYQEASSSGATSTSFKKAVLSLKVKPQITPDGRLQLSIEVNKDSRGEDTSAGPAIDTKKVKSEVLIENGGTVVIGGIYEETDTSTTEQVPLLGDIPVLGHLFKTNMKNSERREMLVFITPRIVADALTLR
jgi:type IV pilus assembly protein PilQ